MSSPSIIGISGRKAKYDGLPPTGRSLALDSARSFLHSRASGKRLPFAGLP